MKERVLLTPTAGVLLLSALWALGWLLPDLFPPLSAKGVSLLTGQTILFSVFAGLAGFLAVVQRRAFPRGRRVWTCIGIGIGLFVIPTVATTVARSSVSDFDAVAILCLTPVFAVVLEPYLQNGPPRRGKAALAGDLVAIAGVLLVFPLETPGSFRAGVAMCLLLATALEIAAANCIAVRWATAKRGDRSCRWLHLLLPPARFALPP